MDETTGGLLNEIINRSDSTLLLFFVLIVIFFIPIGIPLYRSWTVREKERRNQDLEREKIMLNVVEENSGALSGLTVVLKSTYENCKLS